MTVACFTASYLDLWCELLYMSLASLCNLAMARRFKQEIQLARAQVANHIGEHHSVMSMM